MAKVRLLLVAAVALSFPATTCVSQAAAKTGQFEVATVKPTPPANDGRTHINYPAGGDFSAFNVTLLQLVSWAFDIPEKRVQNAPEWVKVQRLDIQAKSDVETSAAMLAMSGDAAHLEKRRMVQVLLQERFGLKTHRETQTLAALDLVVDGTSKLVKSTATGKTWNLGRSHLRGYGLTADILAEQFSAITGDVVVNKTGLDGAFDVSLEWSAEDGSAPDSNAPTFLRAVQEQLGLKLLSAKEPLDVLVVDAVTQPTAN